MDFNRDTIIFLEEDGVRYARIVVAYKGDNIYNVTYTFVAESHRGEGLAGKLVEQAVDYIRKQDGRITATCPYAIKYLEKHEIEFIYPEDGPTCNIRYSSEDKNIK